MKWLAILSFTILSLSAVAENLSKNSSAPQKIYSRHWFGTLPSTKDSLLLHDIFVVNFDTEKKLPIWVAYHLSPSVVWGNLKAERKFIKDPLIPSHQSLHPKHYKGASNCDKKKSGYQKGHLAPLGSFKSSVFAYQAQYLSNIVPQTKALNQGAWKKLEEKIRSFVKKGNELKILTGPVFGKEGKNKLPPCWKSAQGHLQEIPIAFWKVVAYKKQSKIQYCSFLFPQNIKNTDLKKYISPVEKIENQAGIKLFTNVTQPVKSNCKFLL